MSNEPKWSWLDEIQRMAETYTHEFVKNNKPTSITELLDMFNQVAPPATRNGFDDVVDDPRATTPTPHEEPPVAKSNVTGKIFLFTCPACQEDVQGTGHYKLVQTAVPTLDDSGRFVAEMELTGVEADTHICLPGAGE